MRDAAIAPRSKTSLGRSTPGSASADPSSAPIPHVAEAQREGVRQRRRERVGDEIANAERVVEEIADFHDVLRRLLVDHQYWKVRRRDGRDAELLLRSGSPGLVTTARFVSAADAASTNVVIVKSACFRRRACRDACRSRPAVRGLRCARPAVAGAATPLNRTPAGSESTSVVAAVVGRFPNILNGERPAPECADGEAALRALRQGQVHRQHHGGQARAVRRAVVARHRIGRQRISGHHVESTPRRHLTITSNVHRVRSARRADHRPRESRSRRAIAPPPDAETNDALDEMES